MRQELEGGYLWSPKRTKDDRWNRFYQNMVEAEPGDLVLSFANAQVGAVGRVSEKAFEAEKPADYGPAGDNWNRWGWRLPVEWTELPQPVRPKAHIEHLRQWLPKKYSPIKPKTGNGNQGAYLAEIQRQVFDYIIEESGGDLGTWANARQTDKQPDRRGRVFENKTPYDAPNSDTEVEQKVRVRRGQGIFRVRVSKIETKGCRLTGIQNPRLLRAGHIKPWRDCTTYERLDGSNGLLLAPHADHLFDIGYISFDDDGAVMTSSKLTATDLMQLGLADACERNAGAFSSAQRTYLAHHRQHVFKA